MMIFAADPGNATMTSMRDKLVDRIKKGKGGKATVPNPEYNVYITKATICT